MRRHDSNDKTYVRVQDRVFTRRGEWYFQTREGDRGPFKSRKAAEAHLTHFIGTMEFIDVNRPRLPADLDFSDVILVEIDRPA